MRIAIIPARGGSKRVPHKNIINFCGLPMLAWSIKAAFESQCFDRVIVSTDNHKIADVARSFGADVPFYRPEYLSDDYTETIPVVKHAIEWLRSKGQLPDYVCCIYATAPFIQPDDIKTGLDMVGNPGVDYAFSATSYGYPIQRAIQLTDEGRVKMIYPEHFQTRSQDLPETLHDAGQFYWGHSDVWLKEKFLFSESSVAVILPRYRVQDIDTQEDLIRAELMFKALQK